MSNEGEGNQSLRGEIFPCFFAPFYSPSFQSGDQNVDCLVTAVATRWQVQKSDSTAKGGQILHGK